MKDNFNWNKKQVQAYGLFMTILGILLGISSTILVLKLIN